MNIEEKINEKVYIKNPLSSELGLKIVKSGIDLMNELGFENFTFKKLATKIGSTEASIYRYFENKHNFLAYLMMWYWSWLEQKIILGTLNVEDPKIRLNKVVRIITKKITEDHNILHVNEVKLNQIVISESPKLYFSKSVDADNASGFFKIYKSLVQFITDIILEINPKYKYPHMLVSTVVEGAHHQRFFASHLPKLTDCIEGEDAITNFYLQIVNREINQ